MKLPNNRYLAFVLVSVTGFHLACTRPDPIVDRNISLSPSPAASRSVVPPEGNTPLIVLKRGENAFGVGPVYSISIFGDGRIEYVPSQDHPMPTYKAEKAKPYPTPSYRILTAMQIDEIAKLIDSIGFFALNDRYAESSDGCPYVVSDLSSFSITVNIRSGEHKTIMHYLGCVEDPAFTSAAFPRSLKALEDKVVSLANPQ